MLDQKDRIGGRNEVRLSCTASPQIAEAVEQLLWSGFYGNNRSGVVERLLVEIIMQKISEGFVRAADLPPPA